MAIVNFTNYPKGQSKRCMRSVMRYVMQDEKTMWEDQKLVNGINCLPDTVYDDFLNTKLLHHKEGGRMFYHMVQSFPKDADVDPTVAHAAALKLAEYYKDHEVLVCTHVDRDHVHSHFVINSVNFETGKKLHIAQEQIQELKALNDQVCKEFGLPVFEVSEQKKVEPMTIAEYHIADKGESWKFRLMNTIDECMKYAETPDEFIALMRSEGYDVKWTDSRKYITYTTPDGQRCRDNKLHDEKYLKENMINEFKFRTEQIIGRAESSEQDEYFESTGSAALRDDNGAELAGSYLSSLWDSPAAGSGRGRSKKSPDEERRRTSADEDRPRRTRPTLESAIGDTGFLRTGWEDEREFFLRLREIGYEYREEDQFYDGVYNAESEGFDIDRETLDLDNRDSLDDVNGITDGLIRLGYAAAGMVNDTPMRDTTTIPHHTDSKQRRKEQRKRIALGHKPDDHEEEQTWQQTL